MRSRIYGSLVKNVCNCVYARRFSLQTLHQSSCRELVPATPPRCFIVVAPRPDVRTLVVPTQIQSVETSLQAAAEHHVRIDNLTADGHTRAAEVGGVCTQHEKRWEPVSAIVEAIDQIMEQLVHFLEVVVLQPEPGKGRERVLVT
jgi:hypothetical protein